MSPLPQRNNWPQQLFYTITNKT